jgi:large subunit ribosomal protein L4
VSDGKTASFVKQLGSAVEGAKVLVIAAAFDELTYRAARNHSRALLITADEANTMQLLNYRKIIITADAMETLSRRTA